MKGNDMKFIELLKLTKWNKIEQHLLNYYKDTIKSTDTYKQVYEYLFDLKPKETDFNIYLSEEFDKDFDEEPYISVTGKDGTLNKESSDFRYMEYDEDSVFANSEINYSLSLTEWYEWLGMHIDKETINNYEKNEILAHCLWEMTFYGFDQCTISLHTEEFKRRVEEVKNMSMKKERLI